MEKPYNGELYRPVPPQADNDALCAMGERVMIRHHGSRNFSELQTFIAPRGMMYSGFVIGLITDSNRNVPNVISK